MMLMVLGMATNKRKVGRVKPARVFSTLIPSSRSKKLTQDMKLNDKDE